MSLFDWLPVTRNYLNERIKDMATLQDVKDAVAAEASEVAARVNALEARIVELEAGGGATPEQLEELKVMVQGIHTPPA